MESSSADPSSNPCWERNDSSIKLDGENNVEVEAALEGSNVSVEHEVEIKVEVEAAESSVSERRFEHGSEARREGKE
jgi:hypothetical protein